MLKGYKTENTKFAHVVKSRLGDVDFLYSEIEMTEEELKRAALKKFNAEFDENYITSIKTEPFVNGVHFQIICNS